MTDIMLYTSDDGLTRLDLRVEATVKESLTAQAERHVAFHVNVQRYMAVNDE